MSQLVRRLIAMIQSHDQPTVKYRMVLFSMVMTAPQILSWGVLFLGHGAMEVGWLFISFALVTAIGTAVLAINKSSLGLVAPAVLILTMVVNYLASIGLGGLRNSGGQFIWGFVGPMGAVALYDFRIAVAWLIGYLIALPTVDWLSPFVSHLPKLPENVQQNLLVLNCSVVFVLVLSFIGYLVASMRRYLHLLKVEEAKNEQLIFNMLPATIVPKLKEGQTFAATRHERATVLFLDLVGFTVLSGSRSAESIVAMLNELYSRFDSLAESLGLEKIKTIGDSYMVVAGAPLHRDDHAIATVELAINLSRCLKEYAQDLEVPLECRIGIHSGPLISGVIGRKRLAFDVWGDTVNIASRMESNGVPSKIHISEATYLLVAGRFRCEPRGGIEIKGKGIMNTFFLVESEPTNGHSKYSAGDR